jgi:pyruvate kinase
MPQEGRLLKEGEMVTLSVTTGNDDEIFVDYPRLAQEIKIGHPVFLANGDMELVVRRVSGGKISAEVVRGGVLYSRKAVNVPHTQLSVSGLTTKDIKDLKFGLRHGVDFIAVSFVQSARDVLKAKKIVGGKARVIAKIETALALQDIDAIIRVADGIMIARGDLGIEVPEEKLPFIQKNLIRHAAWHNKPSITATQMLTSMVNHPHPTRAEVSDVANAVWDGTDAVMLSDETASGKYPVQSLRVMVKIVKQAEEYRNRENQLIT